MTLAPRPAARVRFAVAPLSGGRFLVSGGDIAADSTAELWAFDPTTGNWEALPDAGGLDVTADQADREPTGDTNERPNATTTGADVGTDTTLATCFIFDPAVGHWQPTGDLTVPRSTHSTVPLPDGRVLAIGGGTGQPASEYDTAECYDPTDGLWRPVGDLVTNRWHVAAVPLCDGGVLVAGGQDRRDFAHPELFDPARGAWGRTEPLPAAQEDCAMLLLDDGRALVCGGERVVGSSMGPSVLFTSADSWIFDPATRHWVAAAPLETARFGHTATLLGDGRVLVVGGSVRLPPVDAPYGNFRVGATSATEIYDPAADRWAAGAALGATRSGHRAALLSDGRVLVIGGADAPDAEVYDPRADRWQTVGLPPGARFGALCPLPDGRLLAWGWRELPATAPVSGPSTPTEATVPDPPDSVAAPVPAPTDDSPEARAAGSVPEEQPSWMFIWTDEPPFPYPAGWRHAPLHLPPDPFAPERVLRARTRRQRIPRHLSADAATLFAVLRDAGAAAAACRFRADYYDALVAQGHDPDEARRRASSQLAWPDLFYPSTPNHIRVEWEERVGQFCNAAAYAAQYDYFGGMASYAGEGVSYRLLDGQLDYTRGIFYKGDGIGNGMRLVGRKLLRYLCYRLDAIPPPRQADEDTVPTLKELLAEIARRKRESQYKLDANAMGWFSSGAPDTEEGG